VDSEVYAQFKDLVLQKYTVRRIRVLMEDLLDSYSDTFLISLMLEILD